MCKLELVARFLVAAEVDGGVDHQFWGLIYGFAALACSVFKSAAGWLFLACGVTEEGRTSWS